jgi:hypothetical protein
MISLFYGNTYGIITWLIPWVGITPFFIRGINSKDKFIKIIDALIAIALVVAILGIFEEISNINVFSFLNTDDYFFDAGARLGYTRIYSFTSHPITYSLYCMFIIILIFYRMTLPETTKKSFYIIAYICVFASALCTFSRSSIIFIILSQLMLLWSCGYRLFFRRMIEGIILLLMGVAVISNVIPNIGKMIGDVTILVLAVFSDNYVSQLAALGYQWDPTGVANRFELWQIVFNQMKGHILTGHGPSTTLSNVFLTNSAGNEFEKTSIEVQPLLILFRYGIFGVVLEEIRNIKQIAMCYKTKNKNATWEGKIGFNNVCLILFVVYFLALFTVNQTDTIRIYMIISCLFISYNIYKL